jgi:glycolate oxidase
LFVGSEGLLGVVTEVTVRLLPARPAPSTVVATFDDVVAAGEAVSQIVASGRPSMCELMDAATLRAVQDYRPMGLDTDVAALLLLQSDAGGSAGDAECEQFTQCCQKAGATFVMTAADAAEGEQLTVARRLAVTALEARGGWVLDDVGVPLSAVPELIAGCEQVAAAEGVEIATFGHAGDGNMHPTVVYDHRDDDQVRRARAAFDAIVDLALSLGGTVSGEHGGGRLKTAHLDAELGDARALGRAIKDAWDPAGTMNPGKAI